MKLGSDPVAGRRRARMPANAGHRALVQSSAFPEQRLPDARFGIARPLDNRPTSAPLQREVTLALSDQGPPNELVRLGRSTAPVTGRARLPPANHLGTRPGRGHRSSALTGRADCVTPMRGHLENGTN